MWVEKHIRLLLIIKRKDVIISLSFLIFINCMYVYYKLWKIYKYITFFTLNKIKLFFKNILVLNEKKLKIISSNIRLA